MPPSEYLPLIGGKDIDFAADERAEPMRVLLMRHWNTIVDRFVRAGEQGYAFDPIVLQHDGRTARANDWVVRFTYGMQIRMDGWRPLTEDKKNGGVLAPFL